MPQPSGTPLNVLIRTAVPAEGDRLVKLLREAGFQPRAVQIESGAPPQAALDASLDLILAELPAGDGAWVPELMALQKQNGLRAPLIIIAGPACEAQAAACLEAGAADYLCSDRLARLGAAVRRALVPRAGAFQLDVAAHYQMLFEHAPSIFLFVRLSDGQILASNLAAEKAYGYPRAELEAMRLFDLRLPDERAKVEQQLLQVRAAGEQNQGVTFETVHRRKDGSIFPVEVSCIAVTVDGVKAGLSIIHDISRRKDAELSLERRMVELEALNDVAQAAAAATGLDDLIRSVVRIVRQRLFPDEFGVALLNEADATLTYHPSAYTHLPPHRLTLPASEGISGIVARTGRSLRVADVRLCPEYVEAHAPVRSELCVPMIVDKRLVGVLNAESNELDYFSAADERLLEAVAGALSTAMEKIRLLETERNRLEEMEALAEISRQQLERLTALRSIDQSILASPDLERTLSILLDKFTKLLRADAVEILLYDHRHQVLLVAAEKGMPEQPLYPRNVAFENTRAGQVALKHQMDFLPDLSQVSDTLTHRLGLIGASFSSYLALPLVAKGELKGVVEIFQRERLEPAPDWMNFLQALTDQAAIAIDNALLFKEQKQSTERLREAYEDTIDGWSRVLDLRDKETEGHSRRVTELTMQLARRLGASQEQLAHIRRGAQLHDIGKMGIPDAILLKPGPLTEEEWEIMRRHPLYALEFLYPIEFLAPSLEIPYCHHEKWDGTGYPQGLSGEQIPIAARIFAVVDVWDALISQRPYRPAWPRDQAIAYIREQSGTFFDPRIVEHFMAILAEGSAAADLPPAEGASQADLAADLPIDE